jgi:hypothetical protein
MEKTMTNNEILNKVISQVGAISSMPIEQKKTNDGEAFSFDFNASLTATVPAYRGFVTGDAIVHLKSIGIATENEDVTLEISEDASFTGGTEVTPIARNRRTELTDYRDDLAIAFNTATALAHQPIHGTPVIRKVMNNGNVLHPAVAVEITADPIGSEGYGIEVKDVAQVDISQGLTLSYKSKQVRKVIKREDYAAADWTPDTLKVFTSQDYAEAKPVIKAVYNNDNVPLVLTSDYTIDKDESNDWGITVLSTSETVDDTKNIIVVFEVEEEYNADYVDEIASFSLDKQKLAVDTITGTFEVGETIEGGTSHATGKIIKLSTGFIYVDTVAGTFVDEETVTGKTSEASTALTADPVKFYWIAFENQSHDDSAITVATVANGTRGNIVEYLSFTADYSFADDSGWKITLLETAKTDASKPLTILYKIYDLISKGDGLKIYTAPTVTDQGNVIETYWLPGSAGVGSSRVASGAQGDWEFILRPNTKYLIKGLSSVTQDIVVKYKWYLED